MRFVSDKKGLSVTIRAGTPEVRDPATGAITRAGVPDLEAKFTHDLLDPAAADAAKLPRSQGGLANTDRRADGTIPDSPFRGQQQDESGKFLPIEIRLGVFDSEIAQLQNGWTDEQRIEVEEALRSHTLNGSMYIEVKDLPAALPWNGYDSVESPEQVLYIASLTNSDLAAVLAYERGSKNRPEFVQALEAEISLLGEAEVVVNA